MRYIAFLLEGEVSFFHVVPAENEAVLNELSSLPAFKAFQENISDSCYELPIAVPAAIVGSPLDEQPAGLGVEMVAPHKSNRKKQKTHDGRKLRRYRCRWKTERFFALLYNYRGCVVHYENKEQNSKAIILMACIMAFLRSYFHF